MALTGKRVFLITMLSILAALCVILIIIYLLSNNYKPFIGNNSVLITELVLLGLIGIVHTSIFVTIYVWAFCCCCGNRKQPEREELEECYKLYGDRMESGGKEVGDDWEKAIDGELKRVWRKFGKEFRKEKSKGGS
jgi:hypothetical protein